MSRVVAEVTSRNLLYKTVMDYEKLTGFKRLIPKNLDWLLWAYNIVPGVSYKAPVVPGYSKTWAGFRRGQFNRAIIIILLSVYLNLNSS